MHAGRRTLVLFLLFCCEIFCESYGGSHCPPRNDIYPCICINKPIGKKKVETIVVCQGLKSSNDFVTIETVLLSLNVDKFLLYDSFWEKESGLRSRTPDQTNPIKFMNSYPMKEVEIVDTILPLVPCSNVTNIPCNRLSITRLTAVNSSTPSRTFSSSCSSWFNRFTSWISCFNSLRYLKITDGNINALKIGDIFGVMRELKEFRLPSNGIQRIEDKTFTTSALPKLQILDLSYNDIRNLKDIFASEMKIEHLDVSHNVIRSLPKLQHLPRLRTLNISSTHIMSFLPTEWAHSPKTLRNIDLADNLINCDCGMKWVNGSFHINTNFIGSCNEPPVVKGMKIRRASRFLIERCNNKNEIVPKSQVSRQR